MSQEVARETIEFESRLKAATINGCSQEIRALEIRSMANKRRAIH